MFPLRSADTSIMCRKQKMSVFVAVKGVNRKAVTLVELLVVVIILAGLAAMAIPRIASSAQNAKAKACNTNLDVINSAIEMYSYDNDNYPTLLKDVIGSKTYFPDGAPVCPLSGTYKMNADYRVTCSHVGAAEAMGNN